ncbi:MAG: hypothetical protein ACXW3Z_10045, partial [Limisphaerales bacterium]
MRQPVDVLYGVYTGGTKPGMRSVKKGDWKLIQYDVMNGSVRETQLFNLKDNPNEFLAEHHDAKVTTLTGITPAKHQVNLARDSNTPPSSGKWKRCCSPRCAACTTPGACGTSPPTDLRRRPKARSPAMERRRINRNDPPTMKSILTLLAFFALACGQAL